MESSTEKKSNKIRDIVRLQRILKKWKKLAAAASTSSSTPPLSSSSCINTNNIDHHHQPQKPAVGTKACKTISPATKFLKKTLSFSNLLDISSSTEEVVPKGYLAVLCVGREAEASGGNIQVIEKRFVIPTGYLGHQAFALLLQEAEEEFGFQQDGILKIPCDVPVFHNILNTIMSTQQHHKVPNQHQPSSFSLPTTSTTPATSTTTTKKWSSPDSNSFLQDFNTNTTPMMDMHA